MYQYKPKFNKQIKIQQEAIQTKENAYIKKQPATTKKLLVILSKMKLR